MRGTSHQSCPGALVARTTACAVAFILVACVGTRTDVSPLPPDASIRLDGIEAFLDLRFAAASDSLEGWERTDELARLERLYVALTALRMRIEMAEAAPSVDDAAEIEADLERLAAVVTAE